MGAGSSQFASIARKWAFAVVPLCGLWEIGAHVVQTRSVVSGAEWDAAKAAIQADRQPGDLVVVAPSWMDSLARLHFGDAILPIGDEARPDVTRFPRALEVSARGEHAPDLAGWTRTASRKVGPFTITTLANPSPVTLADDLLAHASPQGMSAARADGANESPCGWVHGPTQSGGLGFGPAVPGERFACPGGSFIGASIVFDLDQTPHRCFYAPPPGGNAVMRVRFADVAFASVIHGHVGLAYENERDRTGANVVTTFHANGRQVGRVVHVDGDGWKGFELSTSDLQGQKGELVVEIQSQASGRQFCFEADTR